MKTKIEVKHTPTPYEFPTLEQLNLKPTMKVQMSQTRYKQFVRTVNAFEENLKEMRKAVEMLKAADPIHARSEEDDCDICPIRKSLEKAIAKAESI